MRAIYRVSFATCTSVRMQIELIRLKNEKIVCNFTTIIIEILIKENERMSRGDRVQLAQEVCRLCDLFI